MNSTDPRGLRPSKTKPSHRSRELQLVESLAKETITELNVGAVMQRFADELAKMFEFRTVIVTQYVPHKKIFRVLGLAPQSGLIRSAQKLMRVDLMRFDYPFDPERSPIHAGLIKGQRWIGSDFAPFVELTVPAKLARAAQRVAGVKTLCNFPLLVGKTLVGTFIIGLRDPEFSEEVLEFLNTVTPYVSMAVLQARLLEENRILAERYKLLTQVDSQILEERDLQKVLQAIVHTVPELVKCDLSGIHLYDDARAMLVPSLCRSESKSARKSFEVEVALGAGMLGKIAEKKKPEIINNAQDDLHTDHPSEQQLPIEHRIVVPLLSKHTLLGTLLITRSSDEPFQPEDLEIAKRIAEKSALAIQNAQLFTERVEREQELSQLHKSGFAIGGSLDPMAVLFTLVAESLRVIPAAERVAVFRLHEDGRQISVVTATGFGIDKKRVKALHIAERIAHLVVRDRRGIAIHDPSDLNTLGLSMLLKGGVGFQSALAAPILLKGELYGALYLDSPSSSKLLSQRDLARLELFLLHTSLSLSNAQLHAATQLEVKKVQLLFQIKKLAHERPDMGELLQRIARMVYETHRYSFVSIFLYEKRRNILRMIAKDGPEADRVPLRYEQSVDEGILGWVARNKSTKVVQDVEREEAYIRKHDLTTKSELCVPILDAEAELLGVINVESDERYGFSDSDVDALLAIAAEISGVFEERRLLEALSKSEKQYRSLVEYANDSVVLIDRSGKFQFVNKRFTVVTGYTLEEVQGRDFGFMILPDDLPNVKSWFLSSLRRQAESARNRLRIISKSGEIKMAEFNGRLIREGGEIVGIMGIGRDITEEVRLKERLAEAESRYSRYVSSTSEGIWRKEFVPPIDLNQKFEKILEAYRECGRIVEVNPAFVRMYGAQEESQILGRSFLDAVVDWELYCKGLKRFLDNGCRLSNWETKERHFDGSIKYFSNVYVGEVIDGKLHQMWGAQTDVTEAKFVEEALYDSEKKYRNLFEQSKDAIFISTPDGRLIEVNQAAVELFGFESKRELLAVDIPRDLYVNPQDRQKSMEMMNREGFLRDSMLRLRKKNGEHIDVLETTTSIVDGTGTTIAYQGILRDVTSEMQAQQELAKSEESYRRLVREAADAILVSDSEGQLIEVNDQACGLLGYSREELTRMNVSVVLARSIINSSADFKKFYSNIVREGRTIISDATMQRKDGSQFPAEINAVLLGNGVLQAIVRDLSERKHAEEELDRVYSVASTLHGQELFDHAVLTAAQLLKVKSVLVGRLSPDAKSLTVTSLVQNSVHRRDMTIRVENTPLEDIVRRKALYEISGGAGMLLADNESVLKTSIESLLGVPLLDSRVNVAGLICAFDDARRTFTEHEKKLLSVVAQRLSSELEMLEQRKREEQLSRELLQSQKMESLGTLAGGIAHDFNNILGAIMGYTKLLQPSIDRFSPQARYLEAIDKSSQRAATFAKQLLSFAHSSRAEISPVSINEVLRETLQIVGGSFPKSIILETHLTTDTLIVDGDQGQLSQVLMNLFINARDAILDHVDRTERGKLNAAISVFVPPDSFIETHLAAEARPYVCISISDNGIGMPPDVQQRIFEPFYTTKEKGKGTGLGLSTVYSIVKNHKGVLEVESEVGKGSTFRVFLPLSARSLEKAEQVSFKSATPRGYGETILVVDDETLLLSLLAEVLTAHGYHVLSARNGVEAVEIYRREHDRIQLVLLDVVMPEMGGVEAFEKMRAINPEVRVVVCSGFAQDSAVREIVRKGALGFMAKPYLTEDILEFVAKSLRRDVPRVEPNAQPEA